MINHNRYGTILHLSRPFSSPPPVSSDRMGAVSRCMIFTVTNFKNRTVTTVSIVKAIGQRAYVPHRRDCWCHRRSRHTHSSVRTSRRPLYDIDELQTPDDRVTIISFHQMTAAADFSDRWRVSRPHAILPRQLLAAVVNHNDTGARQMINESSTTLWRRVFFLVAKTRDRETLFRGGNVIKKKKKNCNRSRSVSRQCVRCACTVFHGVPS